MGVVFNRGISPRQQKRYWGISSPLDLVPVRTAAPRVPYVNNDTSMHNSAVWAAIRLRADLISTMPVDAFRMVMIDDEPMQIQAPLSPFMASPDFMEWRYSSQVELDRSGNSIGIITDVDAFGYPVNIDLVPSASVTVFYREGELMYRIGNTEYTADEIWHERQYTVSGMPVGLSPVAYGAYVLGQYKTIQEFATEWFTSGATPRARLRNTEKNLVTKEAMVVKEAWRAAQAAGDLFVHGKDWEYNLIQAEQNAGYWLDAVKLSLEDVSRFFGVPADLIDAQMNSPNITYANITQRNLQFLILNLGPAIIRREVAFTKLLPRPRFVKLNTDALLRMDPKTRAETIKTQIDSRVLAPSEARELDNRPKYTAEQMQEFIDLGLNKQDATESSSSPDSSQDTPNESNQ